MDSYASLFATHVHIPLTTVLCSFAPPLRFYRCSDLGAADAEAEDAGDFSFQNSSPLSAKEAAKAAKVRQGREPRGI